MENKFKKLFEGTTEICGRQVGIKIIKDDDNIFQYILSSFFKDTNQIDVHRPGGTGMSDTLEGLFFRLREYKKEFTSIDKEIKNDEYKKY